MTNTVTSGAGVVAATGSESTQNAAELQNGPLGAAVLLMSIGEARAAEVLKHLQPAEVQSVSVAMAGIDAVSQQQIAATLSQFARDVRGDSSLGSDTGSYLHETLVRALGPERATGVLATAGKQVLAPSLDALRWMPDRVIVNMIRDEHPQFIAMVLSYLDSDKAANVVSLFDTDQQSDLMLRVSRLQYTHPAALREVDRLLEKRLTARLHIELEAAGGVTTVAAILNGVTPEQEEAILEQLAHIDPELAEKVRDSMFVFDNLAEMSDRSLQTLLREVGSDTLVKALKGTTPALQAQLFSNMSRRAAAMLQDDLDASGPMRLSDVEDAQREVLVLAASLAEAGRLQLGGNSNDFV